MWIDEDAEKCRREEEREQKEIAARAKKRLAESNKLLDAPPNLTDEERAVWIKIAGQIISATNYVKTAADIELIWQYVQTKIIRDRAWRKFNENPERYVKIVTGICSDGKTPKVLVKENEHYKTLSDCNKQLEKTLKELRLMPLARKGRYN
ncbi:MAG: hypothetical protein LBS99_02465 [Clostridiales bacterium]|jgi:hypothetical protein|nr:hypothetical protein [Clostridiales bacterium]